MFSPKWSKKDTVTCSYTCANRHFRKGIAYIASKKNATYRTICFRYHGKKCLICDETKIVAAHHVNENHDDNRPENLVPLCPTHHQYMHSRYKNLIETKILDYMKKFQDVSQQQTVELGTRK
jgi:hypothetical protein